MEDKQFCQLLNRFGFSWAGYRRVRKGVKKRVTRHMHNIRCRNIEEYIETIEKDRETQLQFERLMTVSISHFFRDIRLWEMIQERKFSIMRFKLQIAARFFLWVRYYKKCLNNYGLHNNLCDPDANTRIARTMVIWDCLLRNCWQIQQLYMKNLILT